MNFVVLSSSTGTIFQEVIEAIEKKQLHARCLGLVTDKDDRVCTEKAEAAGLPWRVVQADPKANREVFDKVVDATVRELIQEAGDQGTGTLIAEMGWMWIHTPWFISLWKNRILNVHPALLPKHGGEGMYGMHVHNAVIQSGEKESGITIHLMDEGVDTGPILVQKSCTVSKDETAESLKTKVQALEKEWYPKTLQMIHLGKIALPK